MNLRILLLPGLLALAACQVTTFENPPVAASPGCDPALVGHWDSVDADAAPGAEAEMSLSIDADCEARWIERHANRPAESGRLALRVGRHGDATYAWVSARRALASTGEANRFPREDMIVVRYQVDGDALSVWNTDDKAIAHAIVDGALSGEVQADGSDVFNRLTGQQDPAVLTRDGFWEAEAGQLRRVAGD